MANCPECDEAIQLKGKATLGQQITCPSCGTDLEVVSLNPLELDWVYEDEDYDYEDYEDEDWDDEDYDEDYDDEDY